MFLLVFNPQQLYSFLVRVIGFHVNFSTLVPMISGKKKKKKSPVFSLGICPYTTFSLNLPCSLGKIDLWGSGILMVIWPTFPPGVET